MPVIQGYDVPLGEVIGSIDTKIRGRLFFNGEQVAPEIFGHSDEECIEKCKAVRDMLKKEHEQEYPSNDWEVRMD